MAKTVSALAVVLPLVFSIVGFVLAMICLFAGTGPQYKAMEPYHIIAINMSNFGHDIIDNLADSATATTTSSSSEPTETDDGSLWDQIVDGAEDLGDDIGDEIDKIEQDIEDFANDLANDAADKLADDLGIDEWYSLHVMNFCRGQFAPNATSPNAWFNTTNCTSREPGVNLNLTKIVQDALLNSTSFDDTFGSWGDDLMDELKSLLVVPDDIQDAVDYLNGFLLALFVFYVLAAGFSGISFLFCIIVMVLRRKDISRGIIWMNVVIDTLAVLMLTIASATVTAISNKGVKEINDKGQDIGISGIRGTKIIILSWVAFGVMFLTLVFWSAYACGCAGRSATKRSSKDPEKRSRFGGRFRGKF
ncbi:hypothetical protein F5Y15DRAFT_395054 [Xylariaceae sp. FL0016]|nr:hypothetical protein F5Y15DRAFT_395054 [Xylariaceae sp. FL0016]